MAEQTDINTAVVQNPDASDLAESKSAFERVQLARHEDRPYTLDYIARLFEDFTEIHGDRRFGDDPAIVCGIADYHKTPLVVIGHQKGRDTKQRQYRNFGMPKPEGYRKAHRVMKLAEKFGRSVVSFIDTPGAYPGIDAEERGQAEAIALNLREMAKLRTPILVIVIGEGGSGGALAIGVADYVIMLENAIYSVISPEGCAAILWKDSTKADKSAANLKLTAQDLLKLGVVDIIVPEPTGGAHVDHDLAVAMLEKILKEKFLEAQGKPNTNRLDTRCEKLQKIGEWGF